MVLMGFVDRNVLLSTNVEKYRFTQLRGLKTLIIRG